MATTHRGSVVWFRAEAGRGVVQGEDGRQYFFGAAAVGELDLHEGVLVLFELSDGSDGPVEARAMEYQGGRKQIAAVARSSRSRAGKPTRKQTQAARRSRTAAPKPPPKPKGAFPDGRTVTHAEFGTGHVIACTKNLVRVEFLSGERRSVQPATLTDVGGPDVPKAPKRRRRAKKATETRTESKRTIRRKKDT